VFVPASSLGSSNSGGDLFSSFLPEPSDSDGGTKIALPNKRECDCFCLSGEKINKNKKKKKVQYGVQCIIIHIGITYYI